jgi:hypothetical protein
MWSQSAKPVIAVGIVKKRPATTASHQAVAVLCSLTPSFDNTTIAVAKVYAPIVVAVSGGWKGCLGKPRRRLGLPPGVDSVQKRPVTPERCLGDLDQTIRVCVVD